MSLALTLEQLAELHLLIDSGLNDYPERKGDAFMSEKGTHLLFKL
jgi:hypothetical protein